MYGIFGSTVGSRGDMHALLCSDASKMFGSHDFTGSGGFYLIEQNKTQNKFDYKYKKTCVINFEQSVDAFKYRNV